MQDHLNFEDRFIPLASAKLTQKSQSLPDHLFPLLSKWVKTHDKATVGGYVPNKIWVQRGVQRLGKSFQSATAGDSNVIYNHASGRTAGKIKSIFAHKRRRIDGCFVTQIFAHVARHRNLEAQLESLDPYRSFPTGGRLYSKDFAEEQIIPLDDIVCHFAATEISIDGISQDCIHVLPLDSLY